MFINEVEKLIAADDARILEFTRICKRGNKTSGKLSAVKKTRLCEYRFSYDETKNEAQIKFVRFWTW